MDYAHEQQAIARGMVNAAANLMFIATRSDPPSWAMLYVIYSIERRKKLGKGFVRAGVISQGDFDQSDKQQDEIEAKLIKDAEAKSISSRGQAQAAQECGVAEGAAACTDLVGLHRR
jgi:hypothetical protein